MSREGLVCPGDCFAFSAALFLTILKSNDIFFWSKTQLRRLEKHCVLNTKSKS